LCDLRGSIQAKIRPIKIEDLQLLLFSSKNTNDLWEDRRGAFSAGRLLKVSFIKDYTTICDAPARANSEKANQRVSDNSEGGWVQHFEAPSAHLQPRKTKRKLTG